MIDPPSQPRSANSSTAASRIRFALPNGDSVGRSRPKEEERCTHGSPGTAPTRPPSTSSGSACWRSGSTRSHSDSSWSLRGNLLRRARRVRNPERPLHSGPGDLRAAAWSAVPRGGVPPGLAGPRARIRSTPLGAPRREPPARHRGRRPGVAGPIRLHRDHHRHRAPGGLLWRAVAPRPGTE